MVVVMVTMYNNNMVVVMVTTYLQIVEVHSSPHPTHLPHVIVCGNGVVPPPLDVDSS